MRPKVEITLGLVEITFYEGYSSYSERRVKEKTFIFVSDSGEYKGSYSDEYSSGKDILDQLQEITGQKVFFRNAVRTEKTRNDRYGYFQSVHIIAEVRY